MNDLRQVDFKYELRERDRLHRNAKYIGISIGLLISAILLYIRFS